MFRGRSFHGFVRSEAGRRCGRSPAVMLHSVHAEEAPSVRLSTVSISVAMSVVTLQECAPEVEYNSAERLRLWPFGRIDRSL